MKKTSPNLSLKPTFPPYLQRPQPGKLIKASQVAIYSDGSGYRKGQYQHFFGKLRVKFKLRVHSTRIRRAKPECRVQSTQDWG